MIIDPDKDDNKVQRRALLLHSAGPDVQDTFDVLADTGSAKDYQKAEDALTRHFVTQINTPYERHLFREMVQGEDETIDQFAIRLRRKAQQCDYGDQMEAQIRDQIISKCRSNELWRKLLEKGQTVTLQTLQEIARNYKAVNEASEQETVSEVKSFLGLVNFNARFIPNLATVAEPLRRLTKKGEPFIFGLEQ